MYVPTHVRQNPNARALIVGFRERAIVNMVEILRSVAAHGLMGR